MSTIFLLIWIHFVADFLLQTDKMATQKSKSLFWLSAHVGVYTVPFLIFGWRYAVFNGLAHFVTDFFTSKITAQLWKREKRHAFFAVIGLDQAIHTTTLIATQVLMS